MAVSPLATGFTPALPHPIVYRDNRILSGNTICYYEVFSPGPALSKAIRGDIRFGNHHAHRLVAIRRHRSPTSAFRADDARPSRSGRTRLADRPGEHPA